MYIVQSSCRIFTSEVISPRSLTNSGLMVVKLSFRVGTEKRKDFNVWIKEGDLHKFGATRAAIVDQTHGELIRNSRFDQSLWSELVPKLIEASAETIIHQRAAKI